MIYWLMLLCAICCEVAATSFLKLSHGWTRLVPSLVAIALFPTSTLVYSLALKKIPISVAYAMWSGVGTVAMAVVGYVVFQETFSPAKLASIGLIIAGITGLQLSSR